VELGGDDTPRFGLQWGDMWQEALARLETDERELDEYLANVYWRLERWPERFSYPARRSGSDTRLTFAKAGTGQRLRVWYAIKGKFVEVYWVDMAPYDEGQDDPF
jgi:hypothetical protein